MIKDYETIEEPKLSKDDLILYEIGIMNARHRKMYRKYEKQMITEEEYKDYSELYNRQVDRLRNKIQNGN